MTTPDDGAKANVNARDTWDALTGDGDIPAWDALSDAQREELEALGYGPLSYPHYVQEYKDWYAQPNATYNLYRFLERQQDTHWGGHGKDYIEGEFEERRELETLRAQLAEREAMLDAILTPLQAAATKYDDGSRAGLPLARVVAELLAERETALREIAALAANTPRGYALATLEQIEAIAVAQVGREP